ncbi:MAG: pantoate kinase [Candidatus Baldrarchaeia archaeon]
MKRAKAFCPGHITAFFEICTEDPDPLKKGSRGAGVSISRGVVTIVELRESDRTTVNVYINGEVSDAPVSKTAALKILNLVDDKYDVRIFHELEIPVGAGFGASGAGAFSTAIAISMALNLPLTLTKIAQIAHISEIECMTGLGDVIAQFHGGVEIRTKAGAPGVGEVQKILVDPDVRVVCASSGVIETKKILADPGKRKKINMIGRSFIEQIIKTPTITRLMELGRMFSVKTGLASLKVLKILKEFENVGIGGASMVMLGESIFCFAWKEDAQMIAESFKKFMPDAWVSVAEIDFCGARPIW